MLTTESIDVRRLALDLLLIRNPTEKVAGVLNLQRTCSHAVRIEFEEFSPEQVKDPGRPERPHLVAAKDLPSRKLGSHAGRMAQMHAFAHIEFNAINLALDAIYRFAMPREYYMDWLSVAVDEARHYTLLTQYLSERGVEYGDFDAHDSLWNMARETAHDALVRMAMVPRVLEARGLDVSPKIIGRLEAVGDEAAAAIIRTILEEEIEHVAIGNRWFNHLCRERELEPLETFRGLLVQFDCPLPGASLNRNARRSAGFSDAELQMLGGN